MAGQPRRLKDRSEAGRLLARRVVDAAQSRPRAYGGETGTDDVRAYSGETGTDDMLVLGIPRGGVAVAVEVARHLGAELDVVLARKLGHPSHPEFGVGAIAPGVRVLDEQAMRSTGVSLADLEPVERREGKELLRRIKAYRADRPPVRIEGRTVIVVDDGVATGVTAKAALQSIRRLHPARLLFAAPVASRQAVGLLAAEADEVVALMIPEPFVAVGAWYEAFGQVSDEEVLRDLASCANERSERGRKRVQGGGRSQGEALDEERVHQQPRRGPQRPEATTPVDVTPRRGSIPGMAPSHAEGTPHSGMAQREVRIDVGPGAITGTLRVPPNASGIVVFAHGSGSSRLSPRNQAVARALEERGLGTFLVDLLTPAEERVDAQTREHRFDIALLAARLGLACRWLAAQPGLGEHAIGLFGSSTGAASALVTASRLDIRAVVSRGGRPDLAGGALPLVRCPTLMIVGGEDGEVAKLNEEARARMVCQTSLDVIPGATHLFEEPGALDRVARLAGDWFTRHLPKRPPRPHRAAQSPKERTARPSRAAFPELGHSRDRGDPAGNHRRANGPAGIQGVADPGHRGIGRALDEASVDELVRRMAKKRLVLMGEATHGTHDFYVARAQLSLRLIEEHGFDFVAVEGDWPDCFRANQWVKRNDRAQADEMLSSFTRWPTWMWANREVADFLAKLRAWNQGAKRKAGFYGLDVYSLWDSLRRTMGYLERIGGPAEQAARDVLACFEPYAADPHEYARRVAFVPESCRDEVVELLAATRAGLPSLPNAATESRLDAEQNAVVAHNAEVYYRAWAQGGPASWNVRDRHMMETLERLLGHHTAEAGRAAKGIVWAHNTHVGDARATDMGGAGMVNLGQLAREQHPANVFLLGFSSYQGMVIAGDAWEASMARMRLPPARGDSLEDRLKGGDRLLLLPEDFPERQRVGHRAVGVVYHPTREAGNYVPTVVRERYDALIHFDTTTALSPLGVVADAGEVPETWPSGM